MDAHGESSREKAAGGYQRKGSPRKVSSGGKIVKKGRPGPGDHEKRVGRWGKAFSPHRSRLRKTKARQLRIRLGDGLLGLSAASGVVELVWEMALLLEGRLL